MAEAGGKVYVIGGFGEGYEPTARDHLAAVALGGKVYAPFRIFNATEVYDPATDRWSAKAPMPTARHGMGAVAVGRRIYVPGGGIRPGPGRTSVLEAFEP